MKKTICILSIMMLVSVSFGHLWTNGSGDQDFTRGSNWFDLDDSKVFTSSDRATVNLSGANAAILSTDSARENLLMGTSDNTTGEVFITGGINTFANSQFAMAAGSSAFLDISGGDTTFGGYFTIGNRGYGRLTVSDGILRVNRTQTSQNAGSEGEYIIQGGEFNVDTFCNVGLNDNGSITMTGGVFNIGTSLRVAINNKASEGIITISGNAVLNALGSYTNLGEAGYGAIYMNGGELNLDRIGLATVSDPNSQGYIFANDGVINISEFFTIGNSGAAGVEVSDNAVINTNRMLLGQGSSTQPYIANGYLTVSGGSVNIEEQLEVSRDGEGTLNLIGNAGEINLGRLFLGNMGTVNFALNGAAGVGKGLSGISADGRLLFIEGGLVGTSFVSGTDVAGDFIVISSSEPAEYLSVSEPEAEAVILPAGNVTDFLTVDSQTAGWTAELYDAGTGSAFVVTSPVSAVKTAWSSAGADDVAVIDDDSISLSSAKAANGAIIGDMLNGSLNVTTGANANFVNMTLAAQAGTEASVSIADGSVAVDSIAYVGKEGSGSLEISGGSFSALNVLAALGENAQADINVSGTGALAVGNALMLNPGSSLTVSGYQSTVEAANITLAEGASINFELDQNHGAGSGIVVSNNVVLDGTINLNVIGGRIDNTYTLIRSEGEIIVNNPDILTSSFATYEVVENEQYQELQLTFFTPEDCEQVIGTGFGLIGDLNEDCYIDLADFAIMASGWLECNNPTDPACELVLD